MKWLNWIMGSSFNEVLEYVYYIDREIKSNNISKVDDLSKLRDLNSRITIFSYQVNAIVLSASLFLMMSSYVIMNYIFLDVLNIKKISMGFYFSLYMFLSMFFVLFYMLSIVLVMRGSAWGGKLVKLTFLFVLGYAIVGCGGILLYSSVKNLPLGEFFYLEVIIVCALVLSRMLLNTRLVQDVVIWAINRRAQSTFLSLRLKKGSRKNKSRIKK